MKSHGDGRRMTLAEAIQRRSKIIRVHHSLAKAKMLEPPIVTDLWVMRVDTAAEQDRRWASHRCCSIFGSRRSRCYDWADDAEDVGQLDGVPVAMCSTCRAAQRERPNTVEVETMEDLAEQFMGAIEATLRAR